MTGSHETGDDWLFAIDFGGRTRRFDTADLPVSIGGDAGDDIVIDGVQGSIRLDVLDDVVFASPERGTRNLRIDGEPVTTARRLGDGNVVALDSARLTCRTTAGRLTLGLETRITAGDTAPPDLDEIARNAALGAAHSDEIEITPIEFHPDAGGGTAGWSLPGPRALAIVAILAVLGVLAWFSFTAESVQVKITPTPASVSLPGTWLKLHFEDRYLLAKGEHRITAELPGYYPLDTTIHVGPDSDQTVALAMKKLPGKVSLAAQPDVQAEVTLDGEVLGHTPLTADIPPGKHRVEFSAPRYLTEVREFDVTGEGRAQSLSVTMTPSWAPVSVDSDPQGAAVFVDGQELGKAPATFELEAGSHALELRLSGYNAWQDSLSVVANQPLTVPLVKLVQADGRIALQTQPAGAAVTVDGKFIGQSPLTLRLTPGRSHALGITKPGYESVNRTVSVEADSGRKLNLDLVEQYGTVDLRSDPVGAEIWVDGEQRGTTPAQLKLQAVTHRIEVRQSGFASASREVTPRPGFPQSLAIELVALDQNTGSGYKKTISTSLDQELVLVPAGEPFTMGTPRGEQGRRSNEILRNVKLSHAFYLSKREVTNAQFRAWKADHDSGVIQGISLNGDDQPVVNVTWAQVAQYLNWLSIKDGLQPVYAQSDGTWSEVRPLRSGYRLPTEAEWAWAARFADHKTPLVYPWGDKLPPPDRSGNFADVSAAKLLPTTLVTYSDGFPVSAPPGKFPANAVGVFDLGGNVSEWVQDYYQVLIDAAVDDKPEVDPLGPTQGRFHVVRGPSWRSATITSLRLAHRDYSDDARDDLGFRIARNLQ